MFVFSISFDELRGVCETSDTNRQVFYLTFKKKLFLKNSKFLNKSFYFPQISNNKKLQEKMIDFQMGRKNFQEK